MSWTDERVERLSKLWLAGRSASSIASELGEGVTRNAVIGKIHRLGLADRSAAVEAIETAEAHAKSAAMAAGNEPAAEETEAGPLQSAALVRSANDVLIPISDRVTIMELRETMCRWPLGDPTSAEFRFCGCRASDGVPYCSTHARLAFQPMADRRRVDRVARFA